MDPIAGEAAWMEALARELLASTAPGAGGSADLPRASVALLLRPAAADLELLLIRRADRAGDPWSGHVALPGGREQAGDAAPAWTAARETREEVGIDPVAEGRLLGALEPVRPGHALAPRIVVHPFVFAVAPAVVGVPNVEVDTAFWLPLRALRDPGAATEHLLELEGLGRMAFPAIGLGGHVVWGLTHRIVTGFLARAARAGIT
jgi:8-oxo-dGTP pyrophosphatase MutT (NUDIX family)